MKRAAILLAISLSLAAATPAMAQKADPNFVPKIVEAVQKKYPDFNVYCQMDEPERKKVTVDTVLDLAIAARGKYSEPVASGLEAGSKLRELCGRDAKKLTAADLDMTSPDEIRANAAKAADLKFPAVTADLAAARGAGMAIYKPDGAGPFPALVLMHRCVSMAADPDLLNWAREAVARGYVAFLVDSVGGRGVDSICYGPKGGITYERGVRDAMQAAEYLRQFDFVDKQRVGVAGFSWGAMVGLMTGSKLLSEALKAGEPPAAVVSVYPACVEGMGIVRRDIERPVLVLMGGADSEAQPVDCIKHFEPMKASGVPIDWHVYPGQTHCWDCPSMNGAKKTDILGNAVVYTYSAGTTIDTAKRMFEFLDRKMAKK